MITDAEAAPLRDQVRAVEALAARLAKAAEQMVTPDGWRTHQDAGYAASEIRRVLAHPSERQRPAYVRGC